MTQHNQISTGSGSDRAPVRSFAETEALITAAQEHFATDFPNPRRSGCPAPGVIQTIVQAERLPDDELLAHLFGCSECFNEYQAFIRTWRAERELTANAVSGWRSALGVLWNWRILAGATATALLLLSAGLLSWRTSAPQSDQVRSQPIPTASVVAKNIQPEPVSTTPPNPSGNAQQPSVPKESLLPINLDLNDYRSLGSQRRGGGEAEPPIPLPRVRAQLLLTLPENSPAGNYRVSLFEGGRKRDAAVERSRNGQTLQIILDFRRVVGSQARLIIERASQPDIAPEDYEIRIIRP